MSRLLPHKYRLLLATSSIDVSKLRRVFPYFYHTADTPSVYECQNYAKSPSQHASMATAWQSSVEMADSLMAGFAPHSSVDIVLANQFVRYCILPAMPPFTRMSERISMATLCLRETYGEAVDAWTIRLNPLPHGDSLLCCALDSLLLEQLFALATRHRLKLNSLQPSLMYGFNIARQQMQANITGSQASCLVQLEQGRIHLILISKGAWQSLASGLLSDNDLLNDCWQRELLQMVSRELLLAGWQPEQTKKLTLYIDTNFVREAAGYAAKQHGSMPEHLGSEYSGWQFVYLASTNKQSGNRSAKPTQRILTPNREAS